MPIDAMDGVTVEAPSLRSGVDRHLKLLASTKRLEQIDDGRPTLATNVGRRLLSHMKFHNGFNPLTTPAIPQPSRLTYSQF